MRTNKKLQSYVDKSMKVNENQDFINKAKTQINENKNNAQRRYKKKNIFIFASCLTVVVIIIAIILLVPKNNEQPEKIYYADNEIVEKSSIEQLNKELKGFSFSNELDVKINRTYDKVYNDSLEYILEYQDDDTFESIEFNIIVNDNYNSPLQKKQYESKQQYKEFELLYNKSVEIEDGIYFIHIDAKVIINDIDLYLSYEVLSDISEDGLIVLLDKCLVMN